MERQNGNESMNELDPVDRLFWYLKREEEENSEKETHRLWLHFCLSQKEEEKNEIVILTSAA